MDHMQVYKLNKICKDKFSTIDIPSSKNKLYKTISTYRDKS